MKQITIAITANYEEVSYSVMDNEGHSWSDTMEQEGCCLRGRSTDHIDEVDWLTDDEKSTVEDVLNASVSLVNNIADEEMEVEE